MKILIVDDHAIVRSGLVAVLQAQFRGAEIAEVDNAADFLNIIRKSSWDIVLLDISMPGRSGLDALKDLRDEGYKTPVLILSMQPEEQYSIRALKSGASGFINKMAPMTELVTAINMVVSGKKYISAKTAEVLADSMADLSDKPLHYRLSDREMQVMLLIASGKVNAEISKEISLSVNTISTYRSRILEKLLLKNNAEITRYAMDHHLV